MSSENNKTTHLRNVNKFSVSIAFNFDIPLYTINS